MRAVGEPVEHIVAQEHHQGDVPALPEILNAGRTKRRVEIERQFDAEQQAEPDRDVGIAGKIKQDLDIEAQRQPRVAVGHRTQQRLRIDRIDDAAEPVGQKDLFEQAHRDEGNAETEFALPARRIDLAAELVHHLRPARQRPGERLREKADVERVAAERIDRRFALAQIDQIHDVVERKERDAERQRDVEHRHRPAQHQAEIVAEKVGVFEERENGEIGDDRRRDDAGQFGPDIGQRGQPVDQDRQHQQQDERRIAKGVERQRQQHQRPDPQLRIGIRKPAEQDGGRQEAQQKRIIVEQHQSAIPGMFNFRRCQGSAADQHRFRQRCSLGTEN